MLVRSRTPSLVLAVPLALAAFVSAARPCTAHDFVRDSIPRKWVESALPEDLPELQYPAYFDDLDKARLQASTGRYKMAPITLRKLKEPAAEQLIPIALAKGQAQFALGRADEALATLADTAQVQLKGRPATTVAEAPAVQVLRARVLADLGRTEEALALLNQHLAAHPESWAGHFWLASVSEQVGDLAAAKSHYDWFVTEPHDYLSKWEAGDFKPGGPFEDAEADVYMGRAADRWAALSEKYRGNTGLPKTILNIFVRAARIDAANWRAHVAAAEYFMSHDERAQAVDELKAALTANPRDIDALRLLGRVHLEMFDFDGCDRCIDGIREIDPKSWVADLLEARNLLHQRRPEDAREPVNRVLTGRPRNIEALGLLAAVEALQLHDDKMNEALAKVDEIDVSHKNSTAYLEVAEQLSAMRQYPRSAEMYKVAIERAPWWTAARNGLGLLYTQSGDEDLAYATLDKARELDPFNAATTNYMRLLDMMLGFTRKETPHFVLMYDATVDPLIPEYFADFLESIHAKTCGEYKFEPKVKTYIEVFPSHEAFSVRTTGSPWIGTVGASTGRVIALVSPRKGARTWRHSTGRRCCATSTPTPSPWAPPTTASSTG